MIRLPRRKTAAVCVVSALSAAIASAACSSTTPPPVAANPCREQGLSPASRFAAGNPIGHPAPEGAKAAKQARAGKITSGKQIHLPANGRNRVRVGDYLIANDKIAAYVGDSGLSDGMSQYGGEVVAIEPVGDDGLPVGLSQYGETIIGLTRETVGPESVTVLADGSDGKAAIIRTSGVLSEIAFLAPFSGLLGDTFGLPATIDYVLEPGAESLKIRFGVLNTTGEPLALTRKQYVGMFHYYRSQLFTEERGFDAAKDATKWVGFDGEISSFGFRLKDTPLNFLLEVSGFQFFQATGLGVSACKETLVDYAEIVPVQGGIDNLRTTIRRIDGLAAEQEYRGTLREDGGSVVAGMVHLIGNDGKYISRARTDANGEFVLHGPAGAQIAATAAGYPFRAPEPATPGTPLVVKLAPHATLKFDIQEAGSGRALPVRIQVLPEAPPVGVPAAYGVPNQVGGRFAQEFATSGSANVRVPAGKHRVIVTRGFEYEKYEAVVDVVAGQVLPISAQLAHSVDSQGVMCGDFHIHTHFSFDSTDSVRQKVQSAIADGLEIPVSSEHEWIVDFLPTIESLGLRDWAYSFPSEELTTFTQGHFGVIPIRPRPERRNNGAIHWIGKRMPEIFKEVNALDEKPVLVINHPVGMAISSYFTAIELDKATGLSNNPDWDESFAAIEVFNDSDLEANRKESLAYWFTLLNRGKSYAGLGASDSHSVRTSPVGYPRTCMNFGNDDPRKLSPELVRDALRAGNIVVSGGLGLSVKGPGGELPGQTLAAPGGGNFAVTVQAPSWLSASDLEVFVDGESAQTLPLGASSGAGPGKLWQVNVDVKATSAQPRHWVVFHAKGPNDLAPLHPGRKPFAVSNPIYFR